MSAAIHRLPVNARPPVALALGYAVASVACWGAAVALLWAALVVMPRGEK